MLFERAHLLLDGQVPMSQIDLERENPFIQDPGGVGLVGHVVIILPDQAIAPLEPKM